MNIRLISLSLVLLFTPRISYAVFSDMGSTSSWASSALRGATVAAASRHAIRRE